MQFTRGMRYGAALLLMLFVAGLLTRTGLTRVVAQEQAVAIPPPLVDGTPQGSSEIAVIAGGCFWGVQGVYQHVKGVTNAISGYAGGDKYTAHYEVVETSTTGHAESVQITFDPRQISYGRILQIFFSVAHDPTLINRQGPDFGPQYRSAIFPVNADQERIARAYIAQLDQAHVFRKPIATKIEISKRFFAAEDYHQDFLQRNPTYPYIVINDLPKIAELKKTFPDLYRSSPVLVGTR
jgi:peptide-methionine (S)-S-oxide reductase